MTNTLTPDTFPPNKVVRLDNRNCIYCGDHFGVGVPGTKEHVIGRRFVPRGSLDNGWNLIAWACKRCNGDKAGLEDDISAISMHPDLCGRFACDDPSVRAEALRKAQGANSRRTGKKVRDSLEKLTFVVPFGGAVTLTFNMTAVPQVDEGRLLDLARYHVQGFFFWRSFSEVTKTGEIIPGSFYLLNYARESDWGNDCMCGFMKEVRACDPWALRVGATTLPRIHLTAQGPYPLRAACQAYSWAGSNGFFKVMRAIAEFGG